MPKDEVMRGVTPNDKVKRGARPTPHDEVKRGARPTPKDEVMRGEMPNDRVVC